MKVSTSDPGSTPFSASVVIPNIARATTCLGSIGSMLRKTLFFSSLIGYLGSRAVGGSIAHEGENLEQVRHHHVPVGAGLLVKACALAETERLGHVDLHMVVEVAIPDRFVVPIAETEREDVLRGLLAQKVVDAKNLVLGEDLVQFRVQRLGARQIRVPNGFSITYSRSLDQAGLRQQPHRGKRGIRRHAEVMQPPAFDAQRQLSALSIADLSFSKGPQ